MSLNPDGAVPSSDANSRPEAPLAELGSGISATSGQPGPSKDSASGRPSGDTSAPSTEKDGGEGFVLARPPVASPAGTLPDAEAIEEAAAYPRPPFGIHSDDVVPIKRSSHTWAPTSPNMSSWWSLTS